MKTRMLVVMIACGFAGVAAAAEETSVNLKNATVGDCLAKLGAINGVELAVRDDRTGPPPAVLKDFAATKGEFWQDLSRLEKAFGVNLEWVGEVIAGKGQLVRIVSKPVYAPLVRVMGRYRLVGWLGVTQPEGAKERYVMLRIEFLPGDRIVGARWMLDTEKSKWQTSDFGGCVDIGGMAETKFNELKGGVEVLVGKAFKQAILDYAVGSSAQLEGKGVKSIEVTAVGPGKIDDKGAAAYSVQFKLDWKYVGLFPCEMKEVCLQDDQGNKHREITQMDFQLDTTTGNKVGLFTFTVAKWVGPFAPKKFIVRLPTDVAEEMLEVKDFKAVK